MILDGKKKQRHFCNNSAKNAAFEMQLFLLCKSFCIILSCSPYLKEKLSHFLPRFGDRLSSTSWSIQVNQEKFCSPQKQEERKHLFLLLLEGQLFFCVDHVRESEEPLPHVPPLAVWRILRTPPRIPGQAILHDLFKKIFYFVPNFC